MELLLKYKTLLMVGLLLAAIAGQEFRITLLKGEKSTLISENTNLSNLLKDSQGTVKQLQNNIITQNTAIDDLKYSADNRKKANAVFVKKAQDSANVYKRRADIILNKVLPLSVDTCSAANILINEEISNAKK